MPREGRLVIKGCPHHVIQRGHNRQDVFSTDEDYRYYLDNLREWKEHLGCRVYAFCLMNNHVHIVVDPGAREVNLALLMKRLAGRQTRFVNSRDRRSGTLWEGRYKSSPISTDEYLLSCCRYVELNPVRAGLVSEPMDYQWSSYTRKVGGRGYEWLDRDPVYLGLGKTVEEREARYLEWTRQAIDEGELELLRQSIQHGGLTGGSRFVEEIAGRMGKRIELRGPGRPKK
ncbi:MAG: transposase [Geobacter sp.]|nr:transposase [Geobacter sp.]